MCKRTGVHAKMTANELRASEQAQTRQLTYLLGRHRRRRDSPNE